MPVRHLLVQPVAHALQVARSRRPVLLATTHQKESPTAWVALRATNALLQLSWPRYVRTGRTGLVRQAAALLTSLGIVQAVLLALHAQQGTRLLLALPLLVVLATLLKERHIALHVRLAPSVQQPPRSLWFVQRDGILLLLLLHA